MNQSEMRQGRFRLKNSPYPKIKVCDYPEDVKTLSFLEGRVGYFLRDDVECPMPSAMLEGMMNKITKTRATIRGMLKPSPPKEDPFFIWS